MPNVPSQASPSLLSTRSTIVAHADRTAQDHTLRDTVLHAGRQIDDFTSYTSYEAVDKGDLRSVKGYMDLSETPLGDNIQVFTCGPLPFMRHVRTTLSTEAYRRRGSATRCSGPTSGRSEP